MEEKTISRSWRIRISCLVPLLAVLGWKAVPRAAAGIGAIEIVSDGFLRESEQRGESSFLLKAGPRLESIGNLIESRLEGDVYVYLNSFSSLSFEVREAYVATSRGVSDKHQITLGRRIHRWSRADRAWRLGLWNPRFSWNPMHPEEVGLLGAFYAYRSRRFSLTAYASPVSVPERGAPISDEGGRLSGAGPYWIPPAEKLMLDDGKLLDMRYAVEYPPIKELILRGSAAIRARYGESRGFWMSAAYGWLPVHAPDLLIEGNIDTAEMAFNSTIHPRVYSRHLLTVESGYTSNRWSLWASASADSPRRPPVPQGWFGQSVGPALILSAGSELKFAGNWAVSGSFLKVRENRPPLSSDEEALPLDDRFRFREAIQMSGRKSSGRLGYGLDWTYDIGTRSHLVGMDIDYRRRPRSGWTFGVSAEWIASAGREGMIGKYKGDDRVGGRVKYEF